MFDTFPDEFKGAEVWSEVIGYTGNRYQGNPKLRFYVIKGDGEVRELEIVDITAIIGFRTKQNLYREHGQGYKRGNYVIVKTNHTNSYGQDVIDEINELFPDAKLTHKDI